MVTNLQWFTFSNATSDVFTSCRLFREKFLMSDVLARNVMMTGMLFLFSKVPLLIG